MLGVARDALLLVDVINRFDFPGSEALLRRALPAARRIAALAARAREAGVPVVYANDNYGRWRSDFRATLSRCLDPRCRGKAVASLLRPAPRDYFVLKPRHSAFYASPLELLLRELRVRRVVVTGFAADSCVQATAIDAYMRGFELAVPADCVAAESDRAARAAVAQMRDMLSADARPSRRLRLR